MADAKQWEDQLIEDMRAHDGQVTPGPLAGQTLMVMTSTGAKSGEPRRAILTYSRDGEDQIVAGTAGGSPTVPGWIHNLEANPKVTIEAANETYDATAQVIKDGPERDRLWDQRVATFPAFGAYPSSRAG